MVQQVPSQTPSSPEAVQPSREPGSSGTGTTGQKLFPSRSSAGEIAKPSRRQRRQRERLQPLRSMSLESQQNTIGQDASMGTVGRSTSRNPHQAGVANRSSARSRMRVVGNDSPTDTPISSAAKDSSNSGRKPLGTANGRSRSRLSKRSKPAIILLYLLRLLILGIGIGVLAGTLLMGWDPSVRPSSKPTSNVPSEKVAKGQSKAQANSMLEPIALSSAIVPLNNEVKRLAAQSPNLTPHVFFVDVDTAAYIDIEGSTPIAAASTIKLPILVAFFQDLDAGKLRLDESLTMRTELMADGSGDMRGQPSGTQFSAWETALKMIVISDNTATNMLIERLGGADALNQRFKSWGLTSTTINKPLPDLEGTNITSARDLANLLIWVNQGQLVSLRSRDHILSIMQRTETNTLLPRGLGEGAMIAHKTGDIGSILGDVGIVDLPNGKRYVATVFVKRPHNDPQARTLIQDISRAVYQHFNRSPRPAQSNTSSESSSTATNSDAFTDADQSTPVRSTGAPRR